MQNKFIKKKNNEKMFLKYETNWRKKKIKPNKRSTSEKINAVLNIEVSPLLSKEKK